MCVHTLAYTCSHSRAHAHSFIHSFNNKSQVPTACECWAEEDKMNKTVLAHKAFVGTYI